MRVFLSLGLVFGLLTIAACKKDASSMSKEEWRTEVSEVVCGKMEECTKEYLKDIPEAQRKMAEAMMPTKEKCMTAQSVAFAKETKEPTEEEKEAAFKCIEAMRTVSCAQMKTGVIPGCEGVVKK